MQERQLLIRLKGSPKLSNFNKATMANAFAIALSPDDNDTNLDDKLNSIVSRIYEDWTVIYPDSEDFHKRVCDEIRKHCSNQKQIFSEHDEISDLSVITYWKEILHKAGLMFDDLTIQRVSITKQGEQQHDMKIKNQMGWKLSSLLAICVTLFLLTIYHIINYKFILPNELKIFTEKKKEACTVEYAQRILNRTGLYCEKVDGKGNPKIEEAIKQFQKSHGLEPTGFRNSETCFALSEEYINFISNSVYIEPMTGMEFVSIPCGVFDMGSDAEGGIIEDIHIDSFYMGKYEVTNSQFIKYRKDHYSSRGKLYSPDEENYPVTYVSWNDACDFAKWLSSKSGKKFRLPTEAEWEYAARGINPLIADDICKYANVRDCSDRDDTVLVGSFQPNDFDLYDMIGNVWEWVEDRYNPRADRYGVAPLKNPKYTSISQDDMCVRRGFAFDESLKEKSCCYEAYRLNNKSSDSLPEIGFRLVKEK